MLQELLMLHKDAMYYYGPSLQKYKYTFKKIICCNNVNGGMQEIQKRRKPFFV